MSILKHVGLLITTEILQCPLELVFAIDLGLDKGLELLDLSILLFDGLSVVLFDLQLLCFQLSKARLNLLQLGFCLGITVLLCVQFLFLRGNFLVNGRFKEGEVLSVNESV